MALTCTPRTILAAALAAACFSAPVQAATSQSLTAASRDKRTSITAEDLAAIDKEASGSLVDGSNFVPWQIPEASAPRRPERTSDDRERYTTPAGWDTSEYGRMRSAMQSYVVPQGRGLALTNRELLEADPTETPIVHDDAGTAFPGTGPLADPGVSGPVPPGGLLLSSSDFLDYDQDRSIIYGHGKMVARFSQFRLTADRLMFNSRTRQLEAYGNVRLDGPTQSVDAVSLVMDIDTQSGVAYQARGRTEGMYFLADPKAHDGKTDLRILSREESALKDAAFTTCEFPVPHWRLQAKELTIRPGDRVFARNAVLYIRDVPVLWLPFATQSLKKDVPWFLMVGEGARIGPYVRMGYRYDLTVNTPGAVDGKNERRMTAQIGIMTDYFGNRGPAAGAEIKYRFDESDTNGRAFLYGMDDHERNVTADRNDIRNVVRWQHRGRVADGLSFLADVDWVSDPEVYFDVLDRLNRNNNLFQRNRIYERRANAALEYAKENLYAGLQVELKERLGRNRVSNFADPRDNDLDFDRAYNNETFFNLDTPGVGPNGATYTYAGRYTDTRSLPSELEEGIPSTRFGRVTQRMPALKLSTSRVAIPGLPLYWQTQFDAFRSIDRGLNTVSSRDDRWVSGFDLRQSLTHQWKIDRRSTLVTRATLGGGVAQWEDGAPTFDIPDTATYPYVLDGLNPDGTGSGLKFIDRDTFLVGTRKYKFSDVSPDFRYAELNSRLSTRLTDALSVYTQYVNRSVNGDSMGQFYQNLGNWKFRDDLYAFPVREHRIEAGFTSMLLRPSIGLNGRISQALYEKSKYTPGEPVRIMELFGQWANARNTLTIQPGASMQQRQFLAPSDPDQYMENVSSYFLNANYLPTHQRYWARVSAVAFRSDSANSTNVSDRNFDTRTETSLSASVGRKIGQKYMLEYNGLVRDGSDSPSEGVVRLSRDLHDAVVSLSFGIRERRLSQNREGSQSDDRLRVQMGFQMKTAGQKGITPSTGRFSLFNSGRQPGVN